MESLPHATVRNLLHLFKTAESPQRATLTRATTATSAKHMMIQSQSTPTTRKKNRTTPLPTKPSTSMATRTSTRPTMWTSPSSSDTSSAGWLGARLKDRPLKLPCVATLLFFQNTWSTMPLAKSPSYQTCPATSSRVSRESCGTSARCCSRSSRRPTSSRSPSTTRLLSDAWLRSPTFSKVNPHATVCVWTYYSPSQLPMQATMCSYSATVVPGPVASHSA